MPEACRDLGFERLIDADSSGETHDEDIHSFYWYQLSPGGSGDSSLLSQCSSRSLHGSFGLFGSARCDCVHCDWSTLALWL